MKEEEEGEGKEKRAGMPEDQHNSDPGIRWITDNALASHSSGRTVE